MKDALLIQACENGHVMVPVAPGRYECRDCSATLENDQIGCSNHWQSSKTTNLCPGVKQEMTESSRPMAV